MTCAGLPHSEIPGSKLICSSPRLIAAYHVLHRLLVPRHPPYALRNLTEKSLLCCGRWTSYAVRRTKTGVATGSSQTDLRCESVFYCQRARGLRGKPLTPRNVPLGFPEMVGLGGVEPPTSRLSGVRSNRLSYSPVDNRITRAEYGPAGSTWELDRALRRRLSP